MANQNKTKPAPDRQDWGDRFAPSPKDLRDQRIQILTTAEIKLRLNAASKKYKLSQNEIINRALDAFLE